MQLSTTLTPPRAHVPTQKGIQLITQSIKQSVAINARLATNVKEAKLSRVSWTNRGLQKNPLAKFFQSFIPH